MEESMEDKFNVFLLLRPDGSLTCWGLRKQRELPDPAAGDSVTQGRTWRGGDGVTVAHHGVERIEEEPESCQNKQRNAEIKSKIDNEEPDWKVA